MFFKVAFGKHYWSKIL